MQANCHCGNVQITIAKPDSPLTRCNCSICYRLGALWGYDDPSAVQINWLHKEPASYQHGNKYIRFYHCTQCGCVTHYLPTDKGNQQRMAVNFRMLPASESEQLQIRDFDGADSWTFIE